MITNTEILLIQLRVQLAKKYVEEWGTRWRDENGRFTSPGATGGKSPGAAPVAETLAKPEMGETVEEALERINEGKKEISFADNIKSRLKIVLKQIKALGIRMFGKDSQSAEVAVELQREAYEDSLLFEQIREQDNFEKRLKEVADPSLTENQRAWRQGVIDAELKYGQMLDQVRDNPSESNYQALITSLRKGEPPQLEGIEQGELRNMYGFQFKDFNHSSAEVRHPAEDLSDEAIGAEITEALSLSSSQPRIAYAKVERTAMTMAMQSEAILDAYKDEYESARLGSRVKDNIVKSLYEKAQRVDAFVTVDPLSVFNQALEPERMVTEARSAAWHETGHTIEFKVGGEVEALAFIADKTSEKKKGTFTSSYDQFVYDGEAMVDGRVRTEVTSTGMEQLATPRGLADGLKKDREHILFTIYMLEKSS